MAGCCCHRHAILSFTRCRSMTTSSRSSSWTLVCVLANCVVVASTVSVLFPFFPLEAATKCKSFRRDSFEFRITVGCVFSVSTCTGFITALLLAKDLANVGSKFILVLSAATDSVLLLLFSFVEDTNDWTWFLVLSCALRACQGVAAAANSVAAFTILAGRYQMSQGVVNGLLRAATSLGFSLGPAIGGTLYDNFGFSTPFRVGFVLMLALTIITLLLLPEQDDIMAIDSGDDTSRHPVLCQMPKVPWVWIDAISILFVCFQIGFLEPTLPEYMANTFHSKSAMSGLALCLYSLAFLLSPFIGFVGDRWALHRYIQVTGLITCAIGCQLLGPADVLGLSKHPAFTFLGTALMGVGSSFCSTCAPADILYTLRARGFEESVAMSAAVGGIVNATFSLGYGTGPLVGSALSSVLGFPRTASLWGLLLFMHAVFVASAIFAQHQGERSGAVARCTSRSIVSRTAGDHTWLELVLRSEQEMSD